MVKIEWDVFGIVAILVVFCGAVIGHQYGGALGGLAGIGFMAGLGVITEMLFSWWDRK